MAACADVCAYSLFQCHQCQDLLENNLARKRPIEVLVGKKNLEVANECVDGSVRSR